MNEKDIITSALCSQKHISHAYHAACEHVDDPRLLNELLSIMDDEQKLRLHVYQAMHQRGWYNPQPIDDQQLQQAKNEFNSMKQNQQSTFNSRQQSASQQPTQDQTWHQSAPGMFTQQSGMQGQSFSQQNYPQQQMQSQKNAGYQYNKNRPPNQ